jgi:hypothetical protein
LSAVPFSEQILIDNLDAEGAASVVAADIDGDLDLDVLVGSYFDGRVSWFENLGAGTYNQHLISVASEEVRQVLAADLDGDGDVDVAVAAYGADQVEWFRNADGRGRFDASRNISTSANGVRAVAAGDFDRDGDLDLVSASVLSNMIDLHENLGGGLFALQRTITTIRNQPRAIRAADVDGNGSLDFVVASRADDAIRWFPGLNNGSFATPRTLNTNIDGPEAIELGDIDGDGDLDLAAAIYGGTQLVWYENNGGGTFGSENVLADDTLRGQAIQFADLDGDRDLDILAGAYFNDETLADKVVWFENTDGQGTFGREQFIARNDTVGVESVAAADLDGDGDQDVLSASALDSKVAWYENMGAGRFARQRHVTSDANAADSIFAGDLDGDGDLDVLAAGYSDNGVSWYQNDGRAIFGKERVITTHAERIQRVRAADLDGDGDLDALSASFRDNTIAWYRNSDGRGSFSPEIVINSRASGAVDVNFADIDRDGDIDVLSASITDATVAWYENLDGQGTFSAANVITRRAIGAEWVTTADLDADGDVDVLSASYQDGRVAWYENTDGQGTFGAAVTVHTGNQANSVESIDVDGDGDLDLAVTLYQASRIVWYENTDGQGTFGSMRIVGEGLTRVETIFIADMDGNGRMDILTAARDFIVWFDWTGAEFVGRQVGANVLGAVDARAADLDGDGDLDVLSASIYDSKVAWYRNESTSSTHGDLDRNGKVESADIDRLCMAIRSGEVSPLFDLDSDGSVNLQDLDVLVLDILRTKFGDANLDGLYNSSDLVTVFQAGEYEDGIAGNSGWSEGDWNCDGDFTTADLVDTFIRGGYTANATFDSQAESNRGKPEHRMYATIAILFGHDLAANNRLPRRVTVNGKHFR